MASGLVVEVVMPQMGVSVSEGTVTRWLKRPGERVAVDEPLLEISTDKVDTEVPSPGLGVLQRVLVLEGETVAVGTVLATIGPEGAEVVAAPPPVAPSPAPPVSLPPSVVAPAPVAPAAAGVEGRAFVSPVVARIAAEHGVDVSAVAGTGRGGRVTKKDILDFVGAGAPAVASPAPVAPAAPAAVPAAPAPAAAVPAAPAAVVGPGEVVEPLSVIRRGIAEHMRRSLDTSAHVTTVFEVDMSRVVAIRKKLKPVFAASYGVNPTYLAFVCRAAVEALKLWPWLNAELRGDTVVVKQHVNLGIAVALEGGKGLIVPNIKHAEEKNLVGIARGIADLAERARSKKLLPDDVQGGTFTITNPGGWGAIVGTPIINQPQVGIIDVEALVKRPVVIEGPDGDDVIAIRPIMNLCLSFDHRLIDGAYAAQFMKQVRDNLETWDETHY